MEVPRLLPPVWNHRQLTVHGSRSQVPENLKVTGWCTVGAGGLKVNSAVGAADATPEPRIVRAEISSARTQANAGLYKGERVGMARPSGAAHVQGPHRHDARHRRLCHPLRRTITPTRWCPVACW